MGIFLDSVVLPSSIGCASRYQSNGTDMPLSRLVNAACRHMPTDEIGCTAGVVINPALPARAARRLSLPLRLSSRRRLLCLSCLQSGWLFRCLSSRRRLPSAGASASHRAIACRHAPLGHLVRLVVTSHHSSRQRIPSAGASTSHPAVASRAYTPPSPSISTPHVCWCTLPTPNPKHLFALYYGANCSCFGGNDTKPSAHVITHGVGMMPKRLDGVSWPKTMASKTLTSCQNFFLFPRGCFGPGTNLRWIDTVIVDLPTRMKHPCDFLPSSTRVRPT